jgi:hypothetical protein
VTVHRNQTLYYRELPTLALQLQLLRINGYSARNYQFLDEESRGGIINPPGFTCSWTRKQSEEWDSVENYQLTEEEEKDSTGNFQLIDADLGW